MLSKYHGPLVASEITAQQNVDHHMVAYLNMNKIVLCVKAQFFPIFGD